MILINDNWEFVEDISDIERITSEYINEEFGHKVKEIYENLILEIEYLKDEIDFLESEVSENEEAQSELDDLNYEINEVKKYIEKEVHDSEYANGMRQALEMITENIKGSYS